MSLESCGYLVTLHCGPQWQSVGLHYSCALLSRCNKPNLEKQRFPHLLQVFEIRIQIPKVQSTMQQERMSN